MSTEKEKPQFSEDPRGGVFIDDGSSITRVEDAPAETPTPVAEQTPEVATDGR